ncbi:hypothetical protein [Aeoliella sp.]|uniref:hypothetical protein n=1 Tax=Aeoliella sp. TaxID=2795800 RepID=UPI003CCC25A6
MYAVAWNPAATEQIDTAWRSFDVVRREKLVESLDIVERQLTMIPTEVGESREVSNERILIEPPLVVYFRVDESKQQVRVLSARVANTDL